MYQFKVSEMHCESCADGMIEALKSADPSAELSVDINKQTVTVNSSRTIDEISRLIEEIGYPVLDSRRIS